MAEVLVRNEHHQRSTTQPSSPSPENTGNVKEIPLRGLSEYRRGSSTAVPIFGMSLCQSMFETGLHVVWFGDHRVSLGWKAVVLLQCHIILKKEARTYKVEAEHSIIHSTNAGAPTQHMCRQTTKLPHHYSTVYRHSPQKVPPISKLSYPQHHNAKR